MHGATTADDRAPERFRERAFRRLPLVVMASAALAGALCGSGWSAAFGPLPWIVALGFAGLPHGAADYAVSQRAWRGWALAVVWLAYAATMATVLAAFTAAPVPALAAFVALSCWHFGTAHIDSAGPPAALDTRSPASLARGCIVLAMPLAAWPAETAAVGTDLAALVVGRGAATDLLPAAAVRVAGLGLAAAGVAALAAEALRAPRRPGSARACHEGLVELAVISGLGWFTHPLFAVGLYFLAWHGWREMHPLAESLTGVAPRSWAALGRAVAQVHLAALPLLVPAWTAIGAAWWLRSPDHSPRSLALVSIAAYLVVTPAHECLGDMLRQTEGRRHQPPPVQPPPVQAPLRRTAAMATWRQPAASSRKTPIFRNLS